MGYLTIPDNAFSISNSLRHFNRVKRSWSTQTAFFALRAQFPLMFSGWEILQPRAAVAKVYSTLP